jgi:hypothetical protein
MLDSMTAVQVRYGHQRTYSCDFYGDYIVRVAQQRGDVVVQFDPDMKLSRGCGEISMSKSVARRVGLALLRAALEDEHRQDIQIHGDLA